LKHTFLDRYSHLQSPVHSLDARLKFVLSLLAIGVLVSEPPGKLLPFAFYGILFLIVLILSRLPSLFFLKRLLFLVPFIGMAALFYPLSYWLTETGVDDAGMQQAILVALSIFFKALLSVSFLILLISTVKFHDLLAGLRKLRMPKLIGILSALMYRYIFIFWGETLRTNMARNSRTPGKLKMNRFTVYGNQMAMIFLRSWERANMVYNAMLSRGFDGEFFSLEQKETKRKDIVPAILFVLILLTIRIFGGLLQL
jgi:cobalt/nickel transport system permease protein